MQSTKFKQLLLTSLSLLLSVSCGWAQSTISTGGNAGNQPSKYTTPSEVEAEFGRFFDLIDKDRDALIPLTEMIDAHNAKEDPKALARINAWDKNRDGRISRAEGVAGVRADLMALVEQQMQADGNGDGVLSTSEYALAVADPQGEKTESGLTKRQEIMFRGADSNKDNLYSRAEALATNSYRWSHSYRGRHAAWRARVFDLNHDRQYDLAEFSLIYGIKPGEPIPQAIQDKFKGQGTTPAVHNYYNVMMRIIHFPLNELEELQKRIDAFEKHHTASVLR